MNVRLVLQRKGKRIWTARLRGVETTLGRAIGCTIRIPSSEISRLHCRLAIKNDLLTVEDLESVNGTFVNGKRIRDIEVVCPGDRLSLGSLTFVVEYELTPAALRQMGSGKSDYEVLEDEEAAAAPVTARAPAPEPPLPLVEPLDEGEAADADMLVLEEGEELNLSGSGGDLREFLIELDDTDDHSKGRSR